MISLAEILIRLKDLSAVTISNNLKGDKRNIQNMPNEVIELMVRESQEFGYDFTELCEDYLVRLNYNIDVMRYWADNYTYKGKQSFVSKRLFV